MKKIIFLCFLFVSLYFGGRVALVWNVQNSDSTQRVSFSIRPGSSLKSIAEQLHQEGLIRDPFVFELFVRWHDLSQKLQAGDYVIPQNLTHAELVDILQRAKAQEIQLTIPEGFTIAQIDDLLVRKALIEPLSFIDCAQTCDLGFRIPSLEGYLFPATYAINPKTFTPEGFIRRLYGEFQKRVEPFRAEIESSGRTLDDIVIMASMIEREAVYDEEMAMISDVLWKRIDEGIALGVDATTRYEINDWKRPLYTADFQKDTPYNTRIRKGMPPTAISNPGIRALQAAIMPEPNPYYFYLHDSSGGIHYGVTYNDHLENKRRYID